MFCIKIHTCTYAHTISPYVNLEVKLKYYVYVLIFENNFYQNKYISEDQISEAFANSFSTL